MRNTKTPLWQKTKARIRLLLPTGGLGYIANFKSIDTRVERILCVTAAGMGDTIMAAPAITALKARFPDASLTVLCHYDRAADEICRLMPSVDETIDVTLESYKWPSVIRFMLCRFWKILFGLRRRRFDLTVVFMPNIIRRLLLAGLGCEYYIYGSRVDDYPGTLALNLLRPLGIEHSSSRPVFDVPEPPNAAGILPADLKRPIICVHPFCGMAWRQWNKFDSLRRKLTEFGGSVVIVGRRTGYESADGGHNLVNKLSVAELFWVVENSNIFITADSGPMHIGFALGTPTVALFGPVRPYLRVPQTAGHNCRIIYNESPGSQTVRRVTQRKQLDNTTMQQISVDEVLRQVKDLLDRSAQNSVE